MDSPDLKAPPRTPEEASDVRAVKISLWLGVVGGAALGIPRYGLFSIGNLAMIGLGIIVALAIHASVVALLPARGADKTSY